MRHADTAQDRRDRLTALLRAGLLAGVALVVVPFPAFAADDTTGQPGTEAVPTATADPSAGSDPSAAPGPTADPAPANDPAPAADPTPSPDPTAPPDPTPSPDPNPTPSPDPTPTPPPTPGIRSTLIYRSAAITRQYRSYWCVPAATQTMWNLVVGRNDIRWARQKSLYSIIRQHNRYRYRTLGNDVQGWAWALRHYTKAPYWARMYTTKTQAVAAIVGAIDRTGHPVGVTIRHGTHAWIVLGYKARPLASDPSQQTILGFYVSGPLGPGSSDPWKYRYVSLASFNKVYTKYHESTRHVIWEGKYVIVSE